MRRGDDRRSYSIGLGRRDTPSSTGLPSIEDPIPTEEDLLSAHVAMGTAIAEASGFAVSVEQAACLGREADLVSIPDDPYVPDWRDEWNEAFLEIFPKCGFTAPDRREP